MQGVEVRVRWRRERVRRGERVAWLALVVLREKREWDKTEAVRLLAERLLLSERQVRNLLSILMSRGYIEPVARGWEVSGLRITRAGEELLCRLLGAQACAPAGEEVGACRGS